MTKNLLASIVFSLIFINSYSQKLQIIETHGKTSFRGLSVYKNTVWVSGTNGTVGKSENGGKTWQWFQVKGFEKTDFRDIEAIDKNTAIIMGIASPAYILKTTDGGNSWKLVYQNNDAAMFMDAMAFSNKKSGLVIGDPINNKVFVATTNDGGESWIPTDELKLPEVSEGEAFFAASGSNIVYANGRYFLVSGGSKSRIFFDKKAVVLSTLQGGKMTGANGMAISGNTILIPAGDYENLNKRDSVFVYSNDGGKTWQLPKVMPGGYRSSACFVGKEKAVTCGITGVDISNDNGKTWKNISKEGFNTCAWIKKTNSVILVGNNGRIGQLQF